MFSEPYPNPEPEKPSAWKSALRIPFLFIAALWGIHLLHQFMPLFFMGIQPREIAGLPGILTAPLVHGSIGHLASNSVPLFVLLVMLMYFYRGIALKVTGMIWLLTGIAVWVLAKPAWHIGASGVIYGLVTFIFWSGVFRRSFRSIILAFIITVLYSGMVLGILPDDSKPISWESHLYGALVGIFVAFYYRNDREEGENPKPVVLEDEPEDFYLPRDLFGK